MGWRERGYSSWEESQADKKKQEKKILRNALIGTAAGLVGAVGLGIGGRMLTDHIAAKHGYVTNPHFDGPMYIKKQQLEQERLQRHQQLHRQPPKQYVDVGTQKFKTAST